MLRTKRLDDAGVANLKPSSKRLTIPDPEMRGHYIRVAPNGSKCFLVVARDPHGKQIWRNIGSPPMNIDDARKLALKTLGAIRATVAVVGEQSVTFEGIANEWFARHVIKGGLISEKRIRAFLKNHIVPAFDGMNFVDVRRKHVTALLDRVEDHNGVRTADHVLSVMTSICNWYAMRDEDYSSPIVKGMKRHTRIKRDRILNDREIAALWKAEGLFGNFTKLALLTAQRKEKLMEMRFDDVRDGVWNIPQENRQKGTGETLPLPQLALDIIEAQRIENAASPFVFAAATGSPRSKLGRLKKIFEAAHPWPQWQLHDLRRSARSIMAAAGVSTLHAELVMGHKQQGVVGIYDRHTYLSEKGEALARLAQRIVEIVSPTPTNVTRLRRAS